MLDHGALVISLDYELMWGLIDVFTKDGYGQTNVKHVPEVIDRMLALFEKYGVHVTFATVGMIMCRDSEQLLQVAPAVRPTYSIKELSPYENSYIEKIKPREQCLFFQPEVVAKLKNHAGVEVATHTFCHFYCWAEGQTIEQFEADLLKAIEVAKGNGIELRSIVFPRNEVSASHLAICAKHGILAYRGNALKYFDEPKSRIAAIKSRVCRLLDSYVNIGGCTSVPYAEINVDEAPMNLRASRLLRPCSKRLFAFEGLRLRRIKKEMAYASQHNEMYHLWWHPHNFGGDIEANMAFLERVLQCYAECHERYGMQSYTMNEMYRKLKQQHNG